MIKPTPGRVVWFTPPDDRHNRPEGFVYEDISQPCSASVAYVHNDRLVNLAVADQYGRMFSFGSVVLLQDDDRKPEGGRFATWMPYQVGQAKKHDEASSSNATREAR